MAVTQYIGSRYVPLFAEPIEWSSANTYEALTIVLHEGNSYTSKQAVPRGIDIDNETYWALTGNFNAQVEQYRRETAEAKAAADDVQNDINTLLPKADFSENNTVKDYIDAAYSRIQLIQNEIKVISPYLQGTAVYLKHGDRALLFDCGDTTDNIRMDNFLFSQDFDKLACVVITHFDHDHYGAFATVAKYCDANTDIFIQMEPPAGTTNYTNYQNRLTEIMQVIQQYGLKTPRVPSEGEIVTYDDIKLELHNTTLANRAAYESTLSESFVYGNGGIGLNNYSLISIVDINNYVITYSGDVEAVAQRLNTQYMRKSALSFTPHHISGVSGYLPWWTAQSPERWLGTTAASTFGTRIYVNNRYLIKLLRYNYIEDVILTHNAPLEVEIINSAYNIIQGESLVATIAEEGLDSCYTVLYQILPPSYISDNPFVIYDLTLAELAQIAQTTQYGLFTASTALTARNDMQIIKDIKALFYGSSYIETSNISIATGRFLDITVHGASLRYNKLEVYTSVDVQNKTGYRLYADGFEFKQVLDTPLGTGDNISTALSSLNASKFLRASKPYIVTTAGLPIYLNISEGITNPSPNMGAGSYIGYAFSTDMKSIYRAAVSNSGDLTLTRYNISTGVTDNYQISAMGANA